eukprot:TRINITY_DN28401_c0_g1_i1.p1 TRINITY_DN28401_c0_g1~~TRINITY_DN28401_c0_g1_i1.p1  ORF type:complete len:626 (+),score=62.99 TRINITY_DN28401_c0_g1_i1:186-2063(+)
MSSKEKFALPLDKGRPLLRFEPQGPALQPAGLDVIARSHGSIFPVAVIGGKGSGQSAVASRLLIEAKQPLRPPTTSFGAPARTSKAVAPPCNAAACDGIDVASVRIPGTDMSLLLMDCHLSCDNMSHMHILRSLVLIMSTLVVYVSSGKVTEGCVMYLADFSATARRLELPDDCGFELCSQLLFILNMPEVAHDDFALETLLKFKAKRKVEKGVNIRQDISCLFNERRFLVLADPEKPSIGGKTIAQCKSEMMRLALPVVAGGLEMQGKQVARLMECLVRDLSSSAKLQPAPLVNGVLEDFLQPVVMKLIASAVKNGLPTGLVEYDSKFADKCPLENALNEFDELTERLTVPVVVGKFRNALEREITKLWRQLEVRNEALGDKIVETVTEEREVEDECKFAELGGRTMFSRMTFVTRIVRVEIRNAQHRQRGGPPQHSDWKETGSRRQKLTDKQLLDQLPLLPVKSGRVWIQWSRTAPAEESYAVLRDFHFLIWRGRPDNRLPEDYFNFWEFRVEVEELPSSHSTFAIKLMNENITVKEVIVQLNKETSAAGLFTCACFNRMVVPDGKQKGAQVNPWVEIRKDWIRSIEMHASLAPVFVQTFPGAPGAVEIPTFAEAMPSTFGGA